jgi:hypothetical protein
VLGWGVVMACWHVLERIRFWVSFELSERAGSRTYVRLPCIGPNARDAYHYIYQTHCPVQFSPQDCLLDFLKLMGDPDRHVRKAAVVAVSAVVHHKPGLVSSGLQELLPLLMDQTVIKPEMVSCCIDTYVHACIHECMNA